MSIVLLGSTSGSCTLQEQAVAGTTTLTLPTTSGTVMVNGPAFSATKITTAQTITTGVATKVTFNSEEFDTANNFASSTFTPTVAGYYIITANAQISFSDSTGGLSSVYIYKNGSAYSRAGMNISSSITNTNYAAVSTVIYMNGTTDYVEMYAIGTSGSATITLNATSNTRFTGCLLRGE